MNIWHALFNKLCTHSIDSIETVPEFGTKILYNFPNILRFIWSIAPYLLDMDYGFEFRYGCNNKRISCMTFCWCCWLYVWSNATGCSVRGFFQNSFIYLSAIALNWFDRRRTKKKKQKIKRSQSIWLHAHDVSHQYSCHFGKANVCCISIGSGLHCIRQQFIIDCSMRWTWTNHHFIRCLL